MRSSGVSKPREPALASSPSRLGPRRAPATTITPACRRRRWTRSGPTSAHADRALASPGAPRAHPQAPDLGTRSPRLGPHVRPRPKHLRAPRARPAGDTARPAGRARAMGLPALPAAAMDARRRPIVCACWPCTRTANGGHDPGGGGRKWSVLYYDSVTQAAEIDYHRGPPGKAELGQSNITHTGLGILPPPGRLARKANSGGRPKGGWDIINY